MKKLSAIFIILLTIVNMSCRIDYVDIDTGESKGVEEATLLLDVMVSGSYISMRSAAFQSEMKVDEYDLFIFKATSDGYLLEYLQRNITPTKAETVSGSSSILIDSHQIELPSAGGKMIVVVANAMANNVTYPTDMKTGELTLTSLSEKVSFLINDNPELPLVMTNLTAVANAHKANVRITLDREVTKFTIKSEDGIVVNSIKTKNAPSVGYPLLNDYSKKRPVMIDYPTGVNGQVIYVLYSPGLSDIDYRTQLEIEGTFNGENFTQTFICPNPNYVGYDYELLLTINGSEIGEKWSPNFAGESFDITGDRLRDNLLTFPFIKDRLNGYLINWTTDITGTPTISFDSKPSWLEVTVENKFARVRVIEDNLASESRNTSFTISLGEISHKIEVSQQEFPGTVTFAGRQWLDRNLGATMASTEENIFNPDTYGYYYQWGRNLPFPNVGNVETSNVKLSTSDGTTQNIFIYGTTGWSETSVAKFNSWTNLTEDPCPTGYHIPTYPEIQTFMPYTNAAGRGNFSTLAASDNDTEFAGLAADFPAWTESYTSQYVTTGVDSRLQGSSYMLKFKGTEKAMLIRTTRVVHPSISDMIYLKVERAISPAITGATDLGDVSDPSARLATAKALFDTATNIETLFFPAAGGRRNNSDTGEIFEQGNNVKLWAGSAWSATQGSTISVDPVATNNRIYSMAGSITFGYPVRCIKDE